MQRKIAVHWGKHPKLDKLIITSVTLDSWESALLEWHEEKCKAANLEVSRTQIFAGSVQLFLLLIGEMSMPVSVADLHSIRNRNRIANRMPRISLIDTYIALSDWCERVGVPIATQVGHCVRFQLEEFYRGDLGAISRT